MPLSLSLTWLRPALFVAAAILVAMAVRPTRATEVPADAGESIYRRGVLGSGAPLEGTREPGGLTARGADAACVNCHQRSGLGSSEGHITIPPITGAYLFHARAATTEQPILPYVEWMHGNRDPYSDATLARAIRDGLDSQGRPLKPLMPHFKLNDADMKALIEYLKQLDARPAPGVTDSVLHFATIITPDADPIKRRGMLDVMEHYFADKNQFPIGPSRQMRTSGKTEYAKSMFMSHRLWKLHVWELTGDASTWRAQLEGYAKEQPVLAVVSGLAGGNWKPVHEFCEHEGLPCLFPNVDVPIDDGHDFYSLYFSRGVLLEAQLMAQAITGTVAAGGEVSVQQIYRAGDSGEAAAHTLEVALKKKSITVSSHALPAGAPGRDLTEALRAASAAKVLVLWLRADDLSSLGDASLAPARVYVSGQMGGLERSPLPEAWRSHVRMAYPVDLPDRRDLRLRYPLNWFLIKRIAVVDEEVQANTYLACGLVAETLSHMADNFTQPYMVELLQSSIERRLINTGYFPRMVLGWNQHFASKGGYIVHFADASGTRLAADTDWLVP